MTTEELLSTAPPADSLYYQNPKFNASQPYTYQPSHYLVKPKAVNARGRGRGSHLPPQHPVPMEVTVGVEAEEEVAVEPVEEEDIVMEEPVEEVNVEQVIASDSIRAKEAMIKQVTSILTRSPPSSFSNADIYSGAGGIAFLFHKLHLLDPLLSFALDSTSTSIPCIQIAKLYIDKSISILATPSFSTPRSYECGFATSKSGVYALAAIGKLPLFPNTCYSLQRFTRATNRNY